MTKLTHCEPSFSFICYGEWKDDIWVYNISYRPGETALWFWAVYENQIFPSPDTTVKLAHA